MRILKSEILSQWHTMFVFLLDFLRFSKLLEILPFVWSNFNNLLKRKQSVCRWLYFNLALKI